MKITELDGPQVVAQLFTKILRDVYGIAPSDTIGIMERDGIWSSKSEEAGYE